MNPEIKARWVDALKSGEYKQGQNVLSDGDSFCCLGVLCELALEDGIVTKEYSSVYASNIYEDKDGSRAAYYLPKSVQEWAGVDGANPELDEYEDNGVVYTTGSLAKLNDEGRSFDEIANVIQEKL